MTPAERALRHENARIIYFLNAANINSEHRDGEESAISRLARVIERWLTEYRAEQKAAERQQHRDNDNSPPEKI
jgi:hypothetical protein